MNGKALILGLIIQQNFFTRSTLNVAAELLGQRLIREYQGQRLVGKIVETEAYIGPEDTACHAHRGRTPRTEPMFGPAGRAYIYLIYGVHHMLNLVTEAVDFPAAVLIRAVEPLEGLAMMQQHRQKAKSLPQLTNGPGKLCQAFQIDKELNGWDVTSDQKLWLEADDPIPKHQLVTGPRIGIQYAQPQDREAPWRFWIRDNRFISR